MEKSVSSSLEKFKKCHGIELKLICGKVFFFNLLFAKETLSTSDADQDKYKLEYHYIFKVFL